ncbi:uncharacterized protein LOC143596926 [Bidens hawaiensis]|uniref:uncharacterized protein LOC143596926 n=1 Tax=Bidens hawaiensis TaxID=980011 RepID=UPI0040499C97
MEYFSYIFNRVVTGNLLQPIDIPNGGPRLSHLLFVDDVVLLGRWSETNLLNVARLLHCFYLVSGLRINLKKSDLFGINVSVGEVDNMANQLHCKIGNFPCSYLGLRVRENMNLISSWNPVVEIFEKRLSRWKASRISMGGRLIFIKSVLDTLPIEVTVEKRKIHWVKWDRVIMGKKLGGLWLGSLRDVNLSLLAKWWQHFKTEPEWLWRRVVTGIHFNVQDLKPIPSKSLLTGVWNNVSKIDETLLERNVQLKELIIGDVGDRKNTLFWLDTWVGDKPLCCQFPSLFWLERRKRCLVRDKTVARSSMMVGTGHGRLTRLL